MTDTVILSSILNVIMLKIKKLLSGKHMVHNFRLSSMYVNESQCMPSHAQVIACKCWKMSVRGGGGAKNSVGVVMIMCRGGSRVFDDRLLG